MSSVVTLLTGKDHIFIPRQYSGTEIARTGESTILFPDKNATAACCTAFVCLIVRKQCLDSLGLSFHLWTGMIWYVAWRNRHRCLRML